MSTRFVVGGWIAWLLGIALLPGCMTHSTLQSIKHPSSKPVHDYVDKVAGASVTESNDLLIYVEARLTNSPHRGQYTMGIPLSRVVAGATPIAPDYTNRPVLGFYELKHEDIVAGWSESWQESNRPVSIGCPLRYDESELVRTCRSLSGAGRTIFPVIDTASDGPLEQIPYKFIYVDTSRPELFTAIRVQEVRVTPETKGGYWVLPFAVIGDIATSPFQLLYFAVYFASGGH